MLLHIDVVNKIATFQKRDGCIVCGNSGYQIQFNFDSEWDGVDRTIVFILPDGIEKVNIEDGSLCPVPIIRNADKIIVGVISTDEKMATTGTVIECRRSILCT